MIRTLDLDVVCLSINVSLIVLYVVFVETLNTVGIQCIMRKLMCISEKSTLMSFVTKERTPQKNLLMNYLGYSFHLRLFEKNTVVLVTFSSETGKT